MLGNTYWGCRVRTEFTGKVGLPLEIGLKLLKIMYTIRAFEEAAGQLFSQGLIPGFIHLSIGQEAVAAGVCGALKKEDVVLTTHRGHGHSIAKGADLTRMMGELLGRAQGQCKGKGGSMHLFDASRNFMGGYAIVGGQIPIAVGLAFAIKYKRENQVVLCFFGDGAVGEGAFHESMNLAGIWKLPVLFVCENNRYATYSDQLKRQPSDNISERVETFGVKSHALFGNDVIAGYRAIGEAIEHVRSGQGPYLVEAYTQRWCGHVGPEDDTAVGYRQFSSNVLHSRRT